MQKNGDVVSTVQLEGSVSEKENEEGKILPYAEARRQAIAAFEKHYVHDLLRTHEGNVSQAARHADIDRVYLHKLIRRHGRG